MMEWDLRPLSLGEILDRTFSLYRRHFLLFFGIAAIPHLLILALNLTRILLVSTSYRALAHPPGQLQMGTSTNLLAFGVLGAIIALIIYVVAYLFAQGGTIYAVSDLYLGHSTTIGASLGRMWGQLLQLLLVWIVNFLIVAVATLLLVIPGIYMACRLITCVPAALLEDLGPGESIGRSFTLTEGFGWRAFVIFFLYFTMLYSAIFLFMVPFGVIIALSAKDPGMMRTSLALMQVGNFFAGVIVSPFFLIAISVYYYDLRVRKEAFDLQLMMNPGGTLPSGSSIVPSMFS